MTRNDASPPEGASSAGSVDPDRPEPTVADLMGEAPGGGTEERKEEDLDTLADEEMSEATTEASVGGPEDALLSSDFVDLRAADCCRVYFTRTQLGEKVATVCGGTTPCQHGGHDAKAHRGGHQHRASPGYYQAYPNVKGKYKGIVDGRLDKVRHPLTQAMIDALRQREDEEIGRATASLSSLGGVADDDSVPSYEVKVETVLSDKEDLDEEDKVRDTDGGTTPLRRVVATMEDEVSRELEGIRAVHFGGTTIHGDTPVVANLSRGAPVASAGPTVGLNGRDPGERGIFGVLREPTGAREYCSSLQHLREYMSEGWKLKRTFPGLAEARAWVSEATMAGWSGPATAPTTDAWVGLALPDSSDRYVCPVKEAAEWLGWGATVVRRFPTEAAAAAWAAEATTAPPAGQWYGVEDVSGRRLATPRAEEMVEVVQAGGTLRSAFDTEQEARAWREQGQRPATLAAAPTPRGEWFGLEYVGGASPQVRRVICEAGVALQGHLSHGAVFRRTFMDRLAAEAWEWEATYPGPPSPAAVSGGGGTGWFGLEVATTLGPAYRFLCRDTRELDQAVQRGAHLRAVFAEQREADAWVGEVSGSATAPAVAVAHGGKAAGGGELEAFLERYEGEDPSVGDKERVHGILCDDEDKMDAALCPPGLPAANRMEFLELTQDVTALPGAYAAEGGDYEGQAGAEEVTEALLTQLGTMTRSSRRGGTDGLWQSKRRHTLGGIKSKKELRRVALDVGKAWKEAWKAQVSRWTAYLLERGYQYGFVKKFCRDSLLARVVRETYANYVKLLTTARDLLQTEERELEWKGSRCEILIEYQGSKLRSVRLFAASYRNHVLGSYIHLRDAAHREFRHEAMMDPLWERMEVLAARVDAAAPTAGGSRAKEGGGGGDATPACSHCRQAKVHAVGKRNCPAKELPVAAARKALKGAAHASAAALTAMCKEIKAEMEAKPDEDVDGIIKAARDKHL